MTELCRMCEEDATVFYVWINTRHNRVWGYCKRCWSRKAAAVGMTAESYIKFMDSGGAKVFYSLEEAQIALVKKQL